VSCFRRSEKIGAFTVCFTGIDGARIANFSDIARRVVSTDTARIQEVHILAGHILSDWVELAVFSCGVTAPGEKSE
jgi:D-sedoheptulose 7-phosphate isomerase